jgi:D-alanine-D-alanine ligase
VANDRVLFPGEDFDGTDIVSGLGLPLVLKTAESGSSIGIEVVDTSEALSERAQVLLQTTESLLVEQWLPGTELTCPVLENLKGIPEALPVVEIRPHERIFFDYESKYDPTAVDELCPAPISPQLEGEIRDLSIKAHVALRCAHYSRTDIRLDAQGRPFILETNTLPGLTPASLMPKSAIASGLSFDALIDRLVRLALKRRT